MGSSSIFGTYINNHHTIPGLIQTMKPDILAINAAKAGYHIHNHLSLLIARSQCVEPDIIILQFGIGDVVNLFFSNLNQTDRDRKIRAPSEIEKTFLDNHSVKYMENPE